MEAISNLKLPEIVTELASYVVFFFSAAYVPEKSHTLQTFGISNLLRHVQISTWSGVRFRLLCLWWSTRYLHHITSSHIRNRTWLHWCRCFNRTMWFNLHLVTTGFVWQYFGFEVLYGGDIAWNRKRRGVRNLTRLPGQYQEMGISSKSHADPRQYQYMAQNVRNHERL